MMPFEMLVSVQAAAAGFMTGLIWFVQIVHYPLLSQVGASTFTQYHRLHMSRTTWVVAPAMFIEAAGAVVLPWLAEDQGDRLLAWTALALLAVVWASTFLWQAPLHQRMHESPQVRERLASVLVSSNWLRTAAWSGRTVVLLAMLAN